MSWNYRVFREKTGFTIREVYYDSKDRPELYSGPQAPYGETAADLVKNLAQMVEAFRGPPLKASDFKKTPKVSKKKSAKSSR